MVNAAWPAPRLPAQGCPREWAPLALAAWGGAAQLPCEFLADFWCGRAPLCLARFKHPFGPMLWRESWTFGTPLRDLLSIASDATVASIESSIANWVTSSIGEATNLASELTGTLPDAAAPLPGELMSGANGANGCGAGKCDVCMGDCDSNADCKTGLSCFQRSGLAPVPGCQGDGLKDWDYCVLT